MAGGEERAGVDEGGADVDVIEEGTVDVDDALKLWDGEGLLDHRCYLRCADGGGAEGGGAGLSGFDESWPEWPRSCCLDRRPWEGSFFGIRE